MSLNWTEALNFLSSFYPNSKDLQDEKDRHLVIPNSHTGDLLIHFTLSQNQYEKIKDNSSGTFTGVENVNFDRKLEVNSVCRESGLNYEELELQFSAEIIRTIGFWLWKKLS